MVKNPRIIPIVFNLGKARIKRESLILIPNMIRFLALNLINNDQTLIVKIGHILASSNNRIRLFARVMEVTTIEFLGALFSTLPYAVLMMVISFDATKNCGYNCSDYCEQLPKDGLIKIYEAKSTGYVFIGVKVNNDARQIAIHIPSKAKQVTFPDFKKTEPVLSSFSDQEEPKVP